MSPRANPKRQCKLPNQPENNPALTDASEDLGVIPIVQVLGDALCCIIELFFTLTRRLPCIFLLCLLVVTPGSCRNGSGCPMESCVSPPGPVTKKQGTMESLKPPASLDPNHELPALAAIVQVRRVQGRALQLLDCVQLRAQRCVYSGPHGVIWRFAYSALQRSERFSRSVILAPLAPACRRHA
jgi:hypothetical protein